MLIPRASIRLKPNECNEGPGASTRIRQAHTLNAQWSIAEVRLSLLLYFLVLPLMLYVLILPLIL